MSVSTTEVSGSSGHAPASPQPTHKSSRVKWIAVAAIIVVVVAAGYYVASGWVAQATWNFNFEQLFNTTTARVNAEMDRQMMLPAGQQDSEVLNAVVDIDLGNSAIVWNSAILGSKLSTTDSFVTYTVSAYGPGSRPLFNTGHYAEVVLYETRTATTADIGSCALAYGIGNGPPQPVTETVHITKTVIAEPCSPAIKTRLGITAP